MVLDDEKLRPPATMASVYGALSPSLPPTPLWLADCFGAGVLCLWLCTICDFAPAHILVFRQNWTKCISFHAEMVVDSLDHAFSMDQN